ncbi:MAG: response regulator transcription factor [Defluviitaleaceae bacterium]|nr:response regulator transcription factor [Defluviitaleaceae bacterium]
MNNQLTKRQISILSTDETTLKLLGAASTTPHFSIEVLSDATSLDDLLTLHTDVLIIDDQNALNLSAIDLCKIIRLKNEEVILIALADMFEQTLKILALELGADDYLAKPANHLEIMVRIKVTLKRMYVIQKMALEADEFKFNDLYLDAQRHKCVVNGIELKLTNHEFLTLLHLVQHSGKTVSRATLLQRIWGLPGDEQTRPVDNVIRRLRKKLTDKQSSSQIVSHWGHGYRIEKGESCL